MAMIIHWNRCYIGIKPYLVLQKKQPISQKNLTCTGTPRPCIHVANQLLTIASQWPKQEFERLFFFLKALPSSACTQHWNWGTRGICPRWNSPVWIFTCDSRAPALGHFKTPVLSTVPHLIISPKYVANWKSKPLSSKKNETKLETGIQISLSFLHDCLSLSLFRTSQYSTKMGHRQG